MVLGLISLAATVPLTVTSVLSLQSQAETRRSQGVDGAWKTNKSHLRARASNRTPEDRKPLFNGSKVVLRDGLLYVELQSCTVKSHPFTGYFLAYPDSSYDGLVSTISNDPPQLNWIFLDTSSLQIRHGLRVEAEAGITGPFGVVMAPPSAERRILLEGWEGFIAVETNQPGLWDLYFDRYDDGLKGRVPEGRRTVELELVHEDLEGNSK
ncbi:hypothetical protein AOQ84DRAFT_211759 [Glonium stellatum]|uniref:Uncharacterized protein n=1 Tax=Glonium stellatum TaxID=574774 RepID=A0A8E2JV47_9PEZI|nr:hypothetical protein AOQ84DRAFT_211759 [Glonium stellatum]